MKCLKQILAGGVAAAVLLGVTGCGNQNEPVQNAGNGEIPESLTIFCEMGKLYG